MRGRRSGACPYPAALGLPTDKPEENQGPRGDQATRPHNAVLVLRVRLVMAYDKLRARLMHLLRSVASWSNSKASSTSRGAAA